MRTLGVFVVFALGLAVGWSLQEVATDWKPVVGSQKRTELSSSSLAASPPGVFSTNQNKVIAHISDDVATLFEKGDYREILRRLRVVQVSGSSEFTHLLEQLILHLQQAAQGGRLETVQDLLLKAREILPQEPRLHYFAAELALAQEDYSAAIALFYELRDSRQEIFSEGQINKQLDLLVDAYRYRLQKQKQTDNLLQLYQLVTARDPTRPEFFYELAKLQYELHNLEQARSSLSYILSDLIWSNRAQDLLAQINRVEMLRTKYHSQIPLSRTGQHFLLTGLIDGIHEVTLLLDTGASYTTLEPGLLTKLGLTETDSSPVALDTGGGRITAQLYNASTMAVGDQALSNIVIAGVPLGTRAKADGLLGMNFLSRFEFFIDQEEAVLYLRLRTN